MAEGFFFLASDRDDRGVSSSPEYHRDVRASIADPGLFTSTANHAIPESICSTMMLESGCSPVAHRSASSRWKPDACRPGARSARRVSSCESIELGGDVI